MNRPNQIIDYPPPKRTRTICNAETKGHSFAKLDLQTPHELIDPNAFVDMSIIASLHECPVAIDPNLEHAEENLVSSNVEAPHLRIMLLLHL